MKKEIQAREQIKLFVDYFYDNVKKDNLLCDIFIEKTQNEWNEHLNTMYRYWEAILLDGETGKGSPFLVHSDIYINEEQFNRWLKLFNKAVEEFFTGEKAEKAKLKGIQMSKMYSTKMEFLEKNPNARLF